MGSSLVHVVMMAGVPPRLLIGSAASTGARRARSGLGRWSSTRLRKVGQSTRATTACVVPAASTLRRAVRLAVDESAVMPMRASSCCSSAPAMPPPDHGPQLIDTAVYGEGIQKAVGRTVMQLPLRAPDRGDRRKEDKKIKVSFERGFVQDQTAFHFGLEHGSKGLLGYFFDRLIVEHASGMNDTSHRSIGGGTIKQGVDGRRIGDIERYGLDLHTAGGEIGDCQLRGFFWCAAAGQNEVTSTSVHQPSCGLQTDSTQSTCDPIICLRRKW